MCKKFFITILVFQIVFLGGINTIFAKEADIPPSLDAQNINDLIGDLPPMAPLPDPSSLPKLELVPPSPPTIKVTENPIVPMVTSPCSPGGSFDVRNPSDAPNKSIITLKNVGEHTDSEITAICQEVMTAMIALSGIGIMLAAI